MCPPCVVWTTHNAVMCVLHVIQKLFVQTCVSAGVWWLCVCDRFSVSFFFMSEGYSEVSPLWFHIFVLAVDAGVLRQINIIFLIFRSFWSEEWRWCEVWVCICLCRSTLPPPLRLLLCCQVFSTVQSPPSCPLCSPKVQRNPNQHCRVKKKKIFWRFLKLWMFQFYSVF